MRIGRAIPGADALLFRHTVPSRLGLIIAVRNSYGIVRKEGMEGSGVKRPAAESTGMYLRRLYATSAISE
ncbi:hypothetical protein CRM79_05435 [Pantoea agglomerans]|nr:hypothetical protein CRM79_05435 [Pantoea agglomerans]